VLSHVDRQRCNLMGSLCTAVMYRSRDREGTAFWSDDCQQRKGFSCCARATAMVVQNRKRGRNGCRRLIDNDEQMGVHSDERDGRSCCVDSNITERVYRESVYSQRNV